MSAPDRTPTAAALVRAYEGRARKRFGQHFLVSDGIIARIVAAAELGPSVHVVEIGPGPGVLTAALLATGARVSAVELDRDCAAHIRASFPDVELVEGDAATVPLPVGDEPWVCVSNLPYNVGTRILMRLLDLERPPQRLVLMLQREVAERLVAPVGSRQRGSLSVAVQARAAGRRLFRVPPGAFSPPPKVESAVVLLTPRGVPLPPGFDALLRAGFAMPRKTLRNNLRASFGDAATALSGELSGRRPAALSVEQWQTLAEGLAAAGLLPAG